MLAFNAYAYCANNPVNFSDPSGEFLITALIIGVVAGALISGGVQVATNIATGQKWSNGLAGAMVSGAVVGGLMALPGAQGVALTLGQTMVWGGLASGLGYGVYNAVNGTKTTLTGYAYAMAFGAVFSGISYKLTSGRVTTYKSRGSTGRTTAYNLKEQLAMKEVVSSPLSGAKKLTNAMTDSRWLGSEGWSKYARNVNGVEIHFNYNWKTGIFDDFKFK